MFRNKMIDMTRALCFLSSAWGQVRTHGLYVQKRTKPTQLLHLADREALRRIETNREMAIAYMPRLQHAIH